MVIMMAVFLILLPVFAGMTLVFRIDWGRGRYV
jgi:hypothetical protein